MKRCIVGIMALMIFCFAVCPAFAKSHKVDEVLFSLSDDYLLYTEESLLQSSDVEGLVFIAISNDGEHQIQCRSTETDFSKQLKSFEGLDKTSVAPAAEIIFPNGSDTVILNSTLYLKSSKIEEGTSSVIYVTVANGKLFTFTYFGDDSTRIGEFMSTVSLPKVKRQTDAQIYMIVLISILIVAVVVILVVLVLSFVKDYKQRKMEQNENIVSQYIKIKRRKY